MLQTKLTTSFSTPISFEEVQLYIFLKKVVQ